MFFAEIMADFPVLNNISMRSFVAEEKFTMLHTQYFLENSRLFKFN